MEQVTQIAIRRKAPKVIENENRLFHTIRDMPTYSIPDWAFHFHQHRRRSQL